MLRVTGIKKNFGAVQALREASLTLESGEIRALLGSNGSGKSTLVKVLSGINRKDGGTIFLDDREIHINSPADSLKYGIAMAYQDLSLLPRLSVVENMTAGIEPRNKFRMLDKKAMRTYADSMIEALGIQAAPDDMTANVDLSNKGLIEVAKAIYTNPKLLILDEITASMHKDQVEGLFRFLKEKVKEGLSVIFVSHRFEEVFDFSSKATILREGVSVADVDLETCTSDELVYHMTGKKVSPEQKGRDNAVVRSMRRRLTVKNLGIPGAVHQADIYADEGEIVGIAGLQGQGQGEFLRALFGAVSYEGSVLLDDLDIHIKSPSDAVKKGIGFISGDREREGIFSVRAVADNILIAETALKHLTSFASMRSEKQKAEVSMKKLNVVAAGTAASANQLSGGNQQKLIVGRWLNLKPKLLLLDDPTKGVDVNARAEINHLLKQMTASGMSILYSSSDNEELLRVADRIYVFFEGRIVKELKGGAKNSSLLDSAMLGADRGRNLQAKGVEI